MNAALAWLFDSSMGVPGMGGDWPPWLAVAFHASNLIMAATFLAVPVAISGAWKQRGGDPYQIRSVLACMPAMAASRATRVIEVFGPPYHLTTLLDCLAAAVSLYSFWRLYPLVAGAIAASCRADREAATDAELRIHAEDDGRDASP